MNGQPDRRQRDRRRGDRRWLDRYATGGGLAAWRRIDLAPLHAAGVRWFEALSPRDRRLFAALAAVAVLALYWNLIWQPVAAARAALLDDIDRSEHLAERLRSAGPDVARVAAARTAAPSSLVTDSADKAGLAIQRIEPDGGNLAVTLDPVGFDALVGWIAALDHDAGLRVIDLKVERRPDPGTVHAQVTLAG